MPTAVIETHELVPELCRQFGVITGWPMHFTALDRPPAEIREELENCPECPWFAEISDGSRPAGFLHLESPADEAAGNFAEAASLAETLARVLGRLAQATAQLDQRNRDVATLLNLGLAVPGQDDLAFSLTQLLQAAAHLTGSWSAAFFLLDASTERLKLRAIYNLARDDVPQPFRQLRTATPDLKALADEPVILRTEIPGDHPLFPPEMRSGACAAVESETAPFGTLWVYDRRAKIYSRRDVQVLQSIAAQVAGVLERSALLRGSEQHERIHRDLKAASETRPDSTLQDLPEDPRYELAGRCTSCYELGGDLCEVIALSGDRTAIAVGDASGNSIPAAMISSAVRGALQTHPAEADGAAGLLSRLNRALCNITRAHQFMSLCYGVYDAVRRTLTYSNAGHPAPLLIRDGTVTPLESHGLLLGVVPEVSYRQSTLELRAGDLLILYSDGISEARSSNNQLFMASGISATVLEHPGESAKDVLEAIWGRVDDFLLGGEGADDRTVLVLKVR
ncbi:MAG: PP2C family protein-serine/threonine phosphatase [Deltaproteobacteria bacterium]